MPFPSIEAYRLARQLAINAAEQWHLDVLESANEFTELTDGIAGSQAGTVSTGAATRDNAAKFRAGTDCSTDDETPSGVERAEFKP